MSDTEKAEKALAKKPLSAYMRFCGVHRSKLKDANPELTFGDLGRMLGQKWRDMGDDDKAEFVDAAKQAKTEWEAAGGPAAAKKKTLKRKQSTQGAANGPKVKRGLSPYMFFAKDNRARIKAENPGATFGEIGKAVGAAWNAMDAEERVPYTKQSKQDKKRYEREVEAAANAAVEKKEESEKSESSSEEEAEAAKESSDESSSESDDDDKSDGDDAAEE